jgi:hypothetical protein|nr:MAG TPA: hypothetical protein [Caudoviricetes sp.]
MSRPFSYNDENFTVIGNILFVHIYIGKKAYEVGDTLITTDTTETTADTTETTADTTETTADTTALDKGEISDTTAFTIPREVMSRVMKTDYGKFVVTNSIPCLRVVLEDGTVSSAKVSSDGVVTLTAPATGKLIIEGTLDIECNY